MGKEYGKFKYEIGSVINTYDRDLLIIDKEYRDKITHHGNKEYVYNEPWYKYRCVKCGNENWIRGYCLEKRHQGCNACCKNPLKIIKGVNDISTTAPWMMKYIKNIDDAYRFPKNSREKIWFKCSDCGSERKIIIRNVCENHTISCHCGDEWSYPNKFMYELLMQLNLNFEIEKTFNWSGKKRYDDYIEYNGLKIIVENHGIQHYKHQTYQKAKTLEDEQVNDKLKELLALNNGIDKYFQIDCRKSDENYIKNSIIKSGLLETLNVGESFIDWHKCSELSEKNLIKEVCEYKNNNLMFSNYIIADKFHISYGCVYKYLCIGFKYGWCKYDKHLNEREMKSFYSQNAPHVKPIYCQSNNNCYKNSRIACDILSTNEVIFNPRSLRYSIQHNQTYNNLNFQYITQEQFNEIKKKSSAIAHGDFFIIKEKTA